MEQGNAYALIPTGFFNPTSSIAAWAYSTPPYSGDGNQTGPPAGTNTLIKTYQCPADDPNVALPKQVNGADAGMITFYGPGDGDCSGNFNKIGVCIDYMYDLPLSFPSMAARQPGATNYIGVAGGLGANTLRADTTYFLYPGIYYPNSKVKLTDIADGTSNTLAFGESIGGSASPRNFHISWMGASGMPTAYGLKSNPNDANWYNFSSKHTGGLVQFSFGDGSVKAISPNVSTKTYRILSGRSDGNVVGSDY